MFETSSSFQLEWVYTGDYECYGKGFFSKDKEVDILIAISDEKLKSV